LLWIEKTAHRLQQQGKKVFVQFLFDRPNQLGLWHMGCLPDLRTHQPQQIPDMFYVVASDPIANCLAGDPLEQAALNTPCLIVQSSFMTATAQQAMVILPAPSYGEENGTYTNNEARVQKVRAIRQPLQGILSTAAVFSRIASSLGKDIGPVTVNLIFRQIKQQVSGYQDLTQDLILGPELNDYGFTTASAATDYSSQVQAVSYRPLTGYTLLTGDNLFRSGKLTAQSKNLSGLGHRTYVEMNPGVNYDDPQLDYQVTITRGTSSFTAPLKINRAFPEMLVFVPEDQLRSPGNKIIETTQYPCPIEVEIKASNFFKKD
jgi:NADH-quinone oxidoreductase subunit G